jgi:hypothetical protein
MKAVLTLALNRRELLVTYCSSRGVLLGSACTASWYMDVFVYLELF